MNIQNINLSLRHNDLKRDYHLYFVRGDTQIFNFLVDEIDLTNWQIRAEFYDLNTAIRVAGLNVPQVATTYTVVSGVSGQNTVTVTDATGIAVNDYIYGTGIGQGAQVKSIASNTLTLTQLNSTTVSGTLYDTGINVLGVFVTDAPNGKFTLILPSGSTGTFQQYGQMEVAITDPYLNKFTIFQQKITFQFERVIWDGIDQQVVEAPDEDVTNNPLF